MKGTSLAIWFILAAGLLIGCNRAKDQVLPDGTKVFGVRTLEDGTRTAERQEFSDGKKQFDVTWLKDGTVKAGRVEFPDGKKQFDMVWLPDGTEKAGRVESPDGEKTFDVTWLKDGTEKVSRIEFPDGRKQFEVITLPDRSQTLGRATKSDGTEIDVADFPFERGVKLQSDGLMYQASAAFEDFIAKYPTSSLVGSAQQRLATVNAAIAKAHAENLAAIAKADAGLLPPDGSDSRNRSDYASGFNHLLHFKGVRDIMVYSTDLRGHAPPPHELPSEDERGRGNNERLVWWSKGALSARQLALSFTSSPQILGKGGVADLGFIELQFVDSAEYCYAAVMRFAGVGELKCEPR